jgi:hypothetical protein
VLGHDKSATIEYARSREVDLWAIHPYKLLLWSADPALVQPVLDGKTFYVAKVGNDTLLASRLPDGLEATRRRLPQVDFTWTGDPQVRREIVERAAQTLERSPAAEDRTQAAQWFLNLRQSADALRVLARLPEGIDVLRYRGYAHADLGDARAAREALDRAALMAESGGQAALAEDLRREARALATPPVRVDSTARARP